MLYLCVSQIGGLIVVQCQAELALISAEVVPHEVGVLLEVDGLCRQSSQPLPPVPVGLRVGGWPARARLGPHAVLEVHHLGGRVGVLVGVEEEGSNVVDALVVVVEDDTDRWAENLDCKI